MSVLGVSAESFNNAMDKASELMVSKALPFMFMSQNKAAEWRYYAHAKKRNKVMSWVKGIIGVATIAYGGSQMLGEAMQGPDAPTAGGTPGSGGPSIFGGSPGERTVGAGAGMVGGALDQARSLDLGIR